MKLLPLLIEKILHGQRQRQPSLPIDSISPPKFSKNCDVERLVWRLKPGAGSLNNLKIFSEGIPLMTERHCVQVAMKAIGLNFADIFACQGLYSATPAGSFIPGLEFSGVVIQVHESHKGKKQFKVGDRVMGVTRFGGYATVLNADPKCIRHVPLHWNYTQGASFCCQALTAFYGLKSLANVRPKSTVLVHSAAGGVGLYCIEILQRMQCNIIATVGNVEKIQFLLKKTQLTESHIIVRSKPRDFGSQLDKCFELIGVNGLDVIMDSLLGGFFAPAFQRLNPMGRAIVFGAGSMTTHGNRPDWWTLGWKWIFRPKLDPLDMISTNRQVIGFNLIWLWDHLDEMGDLLEQLLKLLSSDKFTPFVGICFKFNEAHHALKLLQSGVTKGSVALKIDIESSTPKPSNKPNHQNKI